MHVGTSSARWHRSSCADSSRVNVSRARYFRSSPAAWFVKLNVTSWEETVDAFRRAEEILGEKLDFVFA